MNKSRRQQRRNQRRNQRSNRNRNQQRGGADAFVKDEAVLVGEKEGTVTAVLGNDMYEVTCADNTKETKSAADITKKGGILNAVSSGVAALASGVSDMISTKPVEDATADATADATSAVATAAPVEAPVEAQKTTGGRSKKRNHKNKKRRSLQKKRK